jgi:hypothetical protein
VSYTVAELATYERLGEQMNIIIFASKSLFFPSIMFQSWGSGRGGGAVAP